MIDRQLTIFLLQIHTRCYNYKAKKKTMLLNDIVIYILFF